MPAPKPLSEYERGRLRLLAFEQLEGWGNSKPNGDDFKRWNMERRKEEAAKLVEWAIGP